MAPLVHGQLAMSDFVDVLNDAAEKLRKLLPQLERADALVDEITSVRLTDPEEDPDGEETEP